MALDGALNMAISGLRLVSRQMSQGADNVANAGTPGYSAKRVTGEAVVEGGVRVLEVRRQIDLSLRTEARLARSEAGSTAVRAQVLEPLTQLQGDPASGTSIGGLVAGLRDSLVALRATPASSASQGAALRAGLDVAARFKEISNAIERSRQAVHDGLVADVEEANRVLGDLARLDAEARAARGSGVSDAAVLDRRDAALNRFAELLDVTPVTTEEGGLILILRGGSTIPLSLADNPFSLDAARLTPQAYWGPSGEIPGLSLFGTDVTATLKGGRIGAAIELRDRTLPLMQAELDVTASALATRFDAQGLRLFTAGAQTTTPPPDASEAGYTGAVLGFAQRIDVSQQVIAAPRLLRDGTHPVPDIGFTPNPSDGASGFGILLDAVLNRTFGSVSDQEGSPHPDVPTSQLGPGRNLSASFNPPLRLGDIASAVAASHATLTSVAAERADEAAASQARIDGLLAQREGVDVDSEMATLLQLQNAYTANARVMAVVQEMWDALFAAMR